MKQSKYLLTILLVGYNLIAGYGQINYSQKTRLNDHWEFLKSDLGSVWEAVRPATEGSPEKVPLWESVTLPHCYNATDAVDPDLNYYQGPAWYKTLLTVDNPYQDGRTLLHFEGAGQKTRVYIYTEEVASHVGGYDEWEADITDAVNRFLSSEEADRFGGKIPLSIRCDNSRNTEMIPSDLSDFNLYGGIYRYLNLVYTPALALRSVQVDASVDAKGRKGTLDVSATFNQLEPTGSVNVKIFSPQNKLLKEQDINLENLTGNKLLSFSLSKPALWAPEHPSLYRCEITLQSGGGSMKAEEKFGFRHFEFVRKGPFMLNGKRLLLRGTHRHEDHAGVAAAMTEEMIVEEMEMMKSMGVNVHPAGTLPAVAHRA